jgi:hypothetical protein
MKRKTALFAICALFLTTALPVAQAEGYKWKIEGRGAFTHIDEVSDELARQTGGTFDYVLVEGVQRPLYFEARNTMVGAFVQIAWSNQDRVYGYHDSAIEKRYGRNVWVVPLHGIGEVLADYGIELSLEDIAKIIESGSPGTFKGWTVAIIPVKGGKRIEITQKDFGAANTTRLKLLVSDADFKKITGR